MVMGVSNGSPADGKLKPGDFILQINGKEVSTTDDVKAAVNKVAVGEAILFKILRDRQALTQTIITAASNANPAQPVVGINLTIGYSYEPRVTFRISPDIGGPSAGLIFALAIYDMVTSGDLIADRSVAGTGTITGDGKVGAIGGIQEKIAGAEAAGATVFLVPADNCADVQGLATSVRLVRVATLSDAIAALEDLKDPGRAPTVEGCS